MGANTSAPHPTPSSVMKELTKFHSEFYPPYNNIMAFSFNIRNPKTMNAANRKLDPNETALDNRRLNMMMAFDLGGVDMLSAYLYWYAQDGGEWSIEASKDYSRKNVRDDDVAHVRVLPFMLSTIDPRILSTLLEGSLPLREQQSSTVSRVAGRTCRFENTPGIYINQLRRTADLAQPTQESSPAPDRDIGKFLTWAELGVLLHKAHLYIRGYKSFQSTNVANGKSWVPDTASAKYASEIDYKPGGHGNDRWDHAQGERRYTERAIKNNQYATINNWIITVQEVILRAKSQGVRLDQPLHWHSANVGYGGRTHTRVLHHVVNDSTSALFGLVNAISHNEFPNMILNQRQLLYLCHEDHCNLGETLGSLIASSYTRWLGYNSKPAGAIGTRDTELQPFGYSENIKVLFDPKHKPRHQGYDRNRAASKERLEQFWRLWGKDQADFEKEVKDEQESLAVVLQDVGAIAREVDIATSMKELQDAIDVFRISNVERSEVFGVPEDDALEQMIMSADAIDRSSEDGDESEVEEDFDVPEDHGDE